MDCDTGSPMADTQVRQVFLVAGGGEAVATEYVRSSRLFFTRRSVKVGLHHKFKGLHPYDFVDSGGHSAIAVTSLLATSGRRVH